MAGMVAAIFIHKVSQFEDVLGGRVKNGDNLSPL